MRADGVEQQAQDKPEEGAERARLRAAGRIDRGGDGKAHGAGNLLGRDQRNGKGQLQHEPKRDPDRDLVQHREHRGEAEHGGRGRKRHPACHEEAEHEAEQDAQGRGHGGAAHHRRGHQRRPAADREEEYLPQLRL